MHIADGYLSPATCMVSYAIVLPLWAVAFKKLKENLNEETMPLIASLSALSFIVMMFNIPIPGGTSGHAIGVGIISILFGPWIGFLSVSLVLFIQALLFGDGGLSTLAVNSLGMGFAGAFSASFIYGLTKKYKYSLLLSGWASAVGASVVIALVLGVQPYFGADSGGNPLYFPFGLDVTIPAIIGSHILFFGVVEAIFTQLSYKFLTKLEPEITKSTI